MLPKSAALLETRNSSQPDATLRFPTFILL